MTKKIQVSISLTPAAVEILDELAEENGLSRSSYAGMVLVKHLREQRREDDVYRY